MYITFYIIFGSYLPRGTLIDGSQKCRMGAFCTIAKYSGEMSKKGLKTGQNGVNFFVSPHTMLNNNISGKELTSTKLFKKRGSVKHQNEKY